MAVYLSTIPQLLDNIGDPIRFTETGCRGGCCAIKHRANAGQITIKNTGDCCNPSIYKVQFHGNVTGVQGQILLGIYLDGELVPESLMAVAPVGTSFVTSLDSVILVCTDMCCSRISVRTLTADVTVNTAEIIVTKVG